MYIYTCVYVYIRNSNICNYGSNTSTNKHYRYILPFRLEGLGHFPPGLGAAAAACACNLARRTDNNITWNNYLIITYNIMSRI